MFPNVMLKMWFAWMITGVSLRRAKNSNVFSYFLAESTGSYLGPSQVRQTKCFQEFFQFTYGASLEKTLI